VYTLFVVAYPDFFIKKSCPGYTGQAWADITAASPETAVYIRALERQVGAFGLALTVGALFVLFGAFKKGERWAWFFFLIAAAGGWLVNIIFHIFSKSPLGLAMNLVGIGVVFLALIITAKDFLGKKSS
jgi:FtsH-binding integral membrane protein